MNKQFLYLLLVGFLISLSGQLHAQTIEISQPQKMVGKYDDYEIVGTNSIGTVVHYYSKGSNRLQIYNSKLRPFNELELQFDTRNTTVKKILMNGDLIYVFYTVIERNHEYLKVKRLNYRLDGSKGGIVLDSTKRNALNNYEGYFVKPSLNDEYLVAFTFEEKGNRMTVNYILMNKQLSVLKKGMVFTDDKRNMTLESVKVNNHGDILVVVGHLNKRSGDDDAFTLEQFTVNMLPKDADKPLVTTIEDEGFHFKDMVTNWDEKNRNAILVGTYQQIRDREDVGVFYTVLNGKNTIIDYSVNAFQEADFEGTNAPYRKWMDNAEIQIPKRIIPRSDGGFIYILESEYHDFRMLSSGPTSNTYPYYPEYANYYDENYYYDLKAVSVNPDGTIDWDINMPKIQETENDLGRYSSYFYCGNNNVTKLVFVDDIYGNGNFIEFNFNPKGEWNKQVLLNAYRDDLLLVMNKGKQVSSSEFIVPSEKKNRLRLVKVTY